MSTARDVADGDGTATSALSVAGYIATGSTGNVESWNGSAWTEIADVNTAKYYLGCAGADNTSLIKFGGTSPVTAATEEWNGTSWTEVNDLNTARNQMAGNGTASLGLASGGATPSTTTATEEWTANVPVGAWSTSTALNTARSLLGGGEHIRQL